MTQREKLIELIIESVNGCARHWAEVIADYLLANGVVVLPCKVGDKVYRIVDMSHTAYNSFLSVETVHSVNPTYANIMGGLTELPIEQFDKTIFFTKEEAEKALEKQKGRSKMDEVRE